MIVQYLCYEENPPLLLEKIGLRIVYPHMGETVLFKNNTDTYDVKKVGFRFDIEKDEQLIQIVLENTSKRIRENFEKSWNHEFLKMFEKER